MRANCKGEHDKSRIDSHTIEIHNEIEKGLSLLKA